MLPNESVAMFLLKRSYHTVDWVDMTRMLQLWDSIDGREIGLCGLALRLPFLLVGRAFLWRPVPHL